MHLYITYLHIRSINSCIYGLLRVCIATEDGGGNARRRRLGDSSRATVYVALELSPSEHQQFMQAAAAAAGVAAVESARGEEDAYEEVEVEPEGAEEESAYLDVEVESEEAEEEVSS